MSTVQIASELMSILNVLSTEYNNIELAGYLVGSINNGKIFLEDILIPEQNISQVSVGINPQQMLELRRNYPDKCTRIIGHWHSHHSMGCFWSGTDEDNMKQIADPRKLFVFIVSSQGKHLVRLEMRDPIHLSLNNMQYGIYSEKLAQIREKVSKIIQANTQRNAEEQSKQEHMTSITSDEIDAEESDSDENSDENSDDDTEDEEILFDSEDEEGKEGGDDLDKAHRLYETNRYL